MMKYSFILLYLLIPAATAYRSHFSNCVSYLECRRELHRKHSDCASTPLRTTRHACHLSTAIRELDIVSMRREAVFANCVKREANKLDGEGDPLRPCIPSPFPLPAPGCWGSLSIHIARCQQLKHCCYAAQSCDLSTKGWTTTMKEKRGEVKKLTLQCRHTMHKVVINNASSDDLAMAQSIMKASEEMLKMVIPFEMERDGTTDQGEDNHMHTGNTIEWKRSPDFGMGPTPPPPMERTTFAHTRQRYGRPVQRAALPAIDRETQYPWLNSRGRSTTARRRLQFQESQAVTPSIILTRRKVYPLPNYPKFRTVPFGSIDGTTRLTHTRRPELASARRRLLLVPARAARPAHIFGGTSLDGETGPMNQLLRLLRVDKASDVSSSSESKEDIWKENKNKKTIIRRPWEEPHEAVHQIKTTKYDSRKKHTTPAIIRPQKRYGIMRPWRTTRPAPPLEPPVFVSTPRDFFRHNSVEFPDDTRKVTDVAMPSPRSTVHRLDSSTVNGGQLTDLRMVKQNISHAVGIHIQPLLVFRKGGQPPQRIPPPPTDAEVIYEDILHGSQGAALNVQPPPPSQNTNGNDIGLNDYDADFDAAFEKHSKDITVMGITGEHQSIGRTSISTKQPKREIEDATRESSREQEFGNTSMKQHVRSGGTGSDSDSQEMVAVINENGAWTMIPRETHPSSFQPQQTSVRIPPTLEIVPPGETQTLHTLPPTVILQQPQTRPPTVIRQQFVTSAFSTTENNDYEDTDMTKGTTTSNMIVAPSGEVNFDPDDSSKFTTARTSHNIDVVTTTQLSLSIDVLDNGKSTVMQTTMEPLLTTTSTPAPEVPTTPLSEVSVVIPDEEAFFKIRGESETESAEIQRELERAIAEETQRQQSMGNSIEPILITKDVEDTFVTTTEESIQIPPIQRPLKSIDISTLGNEAVEDLETTESREARIAAEKEEIELNRKLQKRRKTIINTVTNIKGEKTHEGRIQKIEDEDSANDVMKLKSIEVEDFVRVPASKIFTADTTKLRISANQVSSESAEASMEASVDITKPTTTKVEEQKISVDSPDSSIEIQMPNTITNTLNLNEDNVQTPELSTVQPMVGGASDSDTLSIVPGVSEVVDEVSEKKKQIPVDKGELDYGTDDIPTKQKKLASLAGISPTSTKILSSTDDPLQNFEEDGLTESSEERPDIGPLGPIPIGPREDYIDITDDKNTTMISTSSTTTVATTTSTTLSNQQLHQSLKAKISNFLDIFDQLDAPNGHQRASGNRLMNSIAALPIVDSSAVGGNTERKSRFRIRQQLGTKQKQRKNRRKFTIQGQLTPMSSPPSTTSLPFSSTLPLLVGELEDNMIPLPTPAQRASYGAEPTPSPAFTTEFPFSNLLWPVPIKAKAKVFASRTMRERTSRESQAGLDFGTDTTDKKPIKQETQHWCLSYKSCIDAQQKQKEECIRRGEIKRGQDILQDTSCKQRYVARYSNLDLKVRKMEWMYSECMARNILSPLANDICVGWAPTIPLFPDSITCTHRLRLMGNHCLRLKSCCPLAERCQSDIEQSREAVSLKSERQQLKRTMSICEATNLFQRIGRDTRS